MFKLLEHRRNDLTSGPVYLSGVSSQVRLSVVVGGLYTHFSGDLLRSGVDSSVGSTVQKGVLSLFDRVTRTTLRIGCFRYS